MRPRGSRSARRRTRDGSSGPRSVAALHRAGDALAAHRAAERRQARRLPARTGGGARSPCLEPIVLVLDDFHEVDDPAVMRDLDRLLDHAPDRLRLVLATRSDPSLRLQRLRIAGRLERGQERRSGVHRPRDASSCSAALGLPIGPRRSTSCSGIGPRAGWPASGSPRSRSTTTPTPSAFIQGFAGDDRAVSDYLMSEVVSRQTPDDARLPAPHRDRGTGERLARPTRSPGPSGGQSRLEELVQPRRPRRPRSTTRGPWFAYHPLLRELLRVELTRRMPAGSGRAPRPSRAAGTASATRCSPRFATHCSERTGSWPRTCSGGTG